MKHSISYSSNEITTFGPFNLIGVTDRFSYNDRISVSRVWIEWLQKSSTVLKIDPHFNVGISTYDDVSTFGYFAGCSQTEIANIADLPAEFSQTHIPKANYFRFEHTGSPLALRETMEDIWANKIPNLDFISDPSFTIQTFSGDPNLDPDNLEVEILFPITS